MNEIEVVRDISQKLERPGIPYMLTGAMAMNYYAQPRMTREIKVVIAIPCKETDPIVRLSHPDMWTQKACTKQWFMNPSLI